MSKTVTLGKRLVPIEHIALIEPFDPSAHPRMQTERPFKARVVLCDRESMLTEIPANVFAEANAFRELAEDGVFVNPLVNFGVEVFHPDEEFKPTKPYQSRLTWRDYEGNTQSKLLLAKPETVLAIAVRGELPAESENSESATATSTRPRARRVRRREQQAAPSRG